MLDYLLFPFIAPVTLAFSFFSIAMKFMMLLPTHMLILIGFAVGCFILRVIIL